MTDSAPSVPDASGALPALMGRAGSRRRIYICPIGTSDPHSQGFASQDGPAVAIARAIQPHRIYLLPTKKRGDVTVHTEEEAELTQLRLDEAGLMPPEGLFTECLDVRDVTDFAELLPEFERIVRRIRESCEPADSEAQTGRCYYFVNGTSGTSQIQMTSALLVATGVISPATLVQAADPRRQTRPERIVPVDVQFAVERQRADEALGLLAVGAFSAAGMLLDGLAKSASTPRRRQTAEIGACLARAYAAMDQMDYAPAASELERAVKAVRTSDVAAGFSTVLALLKQQETTLAAHQRRSYREDELFLADLYHSAERRLAAGLYSDAIGRAWRLIEGGLHSYLHVQHGIDAVRLENSLQQERAQAIATRVCHRSVLTGDSLSLWQCRQALAEVLNDTAFGRYLDGQMQVVGVGLVVKSDEWEEVRRWRNRSVIAHGIQAVPATHARRAQALAHDLITTFLGLRDAVDGYAFRRSEINRVIGLLRSELRA